MARGEYAIQQCDYCKIQLYANELSSITDRIQTGERRGRRVYASSRGTFGGGTSRSDYYRLDHLRICTPCYQQRAAELRRQANARLFGGLIVIGLIIAIVAFVVRRGGARSENAELTDASIQTSTPAAEATQSTQSSLQTNNIANTVDPTSSDQQNQGETQSGNASKGEPERGTIDSAEEAGRVLREKKIIDAIKAATPVALDSGRPEMWRASTLKGYVVPSAPQVYDDRTCANVYATKIDADDQTQTNTVKWCKFNSSAEWKLTPDGTDYVAYPDFHTLPASQ